MYLEKINCPQDVRKLTIEQLDVLAGEIREGVLNRVSNHGGHVGPNLGITEATIALLYVLTSSLKKTKHYNSLINNIL